MKKNLFKLAGLVISAMLLGACSQMATFENEDLTNGLEKADQAGFNLNPYNPGGFENAMILSGGGDYLTDCITTTSSDTFKASGDLTGTWGGKEGTDKSKTLDVEVWNTLTTIEYRFLLTGDKGNIQFYDETLTPADWVNAGKLETGIPLTISRPLPIGWKAGDVITEQWRQTGGGAPLGGNETDVIENDVVILESGIVSYALIGICTTSTISAGTIEPICEDEVFPITATVSSFGDFTGGKIQIWDASDVVVATANVSESVKSVSYDFSGSVGSYDFTAHYVGAGSNGYNNSESESITVEVIECVVGCEESFGYVDNENGTYTFTYIPNADLDNAELVFTFPQSALNGDALPGWTYSGQTMQTTQDLVACTTYTWTVSLSCKPLNNPQNKWTEFKVNDISKKGSLSNIKCE